MIILKYAKDKGIVLCTCVEVRRIENSQTTIRVEHGTNQGAKIPLSNYEYSESRIYSQQH